jgi:hypothetical protein
MVRSRVAGQVEAPEPTSTGRCGPKLQLTWQRVDAHLTPCLDLELVCRGTRSSGVLRTRRLGQFFDAPLGYFEIFIRQSTAGPGEVPELEVRERPPSTLRKVDGGPREVPELEVQKLKTSMADPMGGASDRSGSGNHRS